MTQFLAASSEMPEVQRCGAPMEEPNITWGNSSSTPPKQRNKMLTLITLKAGCPVYLLTVAGFIALLCVYVFWKDLVPNSWRLANKVSFH